MELVLEIKSLLLEACVGFPLLLSLVSTRCCFSFLTLALVVVVFLDSQKNSYEQWNIIVLIDLQCSFMTINLYRSLFCFFFYLAFATEGVAFSSPPSEFLTSSVFPSTIDNISRIRRSWSRKGNAATKDFFSQKKSVVIDSSMGFSIYLTIMKSTGVSMTCVGKEVESYRLPSK